MRRICFLLITLNLVSAATGVAFLKIPVDARVSGIGEAAAGYVDNAAALFYNPAGLAGIESFSALVMHNQWLVGMNHEYAAAGYGNQSLGTFALSFNYWGSGEIQGMDVRGETVPGYSFSAADWCLNLGYAHELGPLDLGLGLKMVREMNESLASSGFGFDFGARYRLPVQGLKAGLAVTNLGTKLKLDQEAYSLPLAVRLGWRYDRWGLGLAQDFIVSSTEKPGIAVGAEYLIAGLASVRLGYRTGSDYAGFSGLRAGLGFRYYGFSIDYAFAPYGSLGASHRLSLAYGNQRPTDVE